MKYACLIFLLILCSCSQKQPVKNDNNDKPINVESLVKDFKKVLAKNDKEMLSKEILYPLNREHPLPEVTDQANFLNRSDEIFDEKLKTRLLNSDIEQWEPVGSRGLMFDNGTVWLDFSGRVFAVNYQSAVEKEKAAILLANQSNSLHESVKDFDKAVLEFESDRFRVRIDDLGDYQYRYASWGDGSPTSDKPDLILTGGEKKYQGSGGDYLYEFINGKYRYVIMSNKLGPNGSAPAYLKVYYRDKETLSEDAVRFKD